MRCQINSDRKPPQAYLLCGGQSRRFGSDKALIILHQQPLIVELYQSLCSWTESVFAIADRAGKYDSLTIPTLADHWKNMGPLAGLHAALLHNRETANHDWLVLLSCDMTIVESDWLDRLWNATTDSSDDSRFQAIFFQEFVSASQPGRDHPFPGCYHVSLIEILEEQLKEQKRSFYKFFERLGPACLRLPCPKNWPQVPQINTPEDVDAWRNGYSRRSGKH